MRFLLTPALGTFLATTGVGQPPPKAAPPLTSAQQAKLEEREKFWADARAAEKDGKLAEAIALGAKAVAFERDAWAEKDPRLATSLEILGGWYLDAGQWAAARTAREEVLALLSAAHGKDNWRVTDARHALADVGRFEKTTLEDLSALRKARDQSAEGERLAGAGKWAEARRPFEEALATRRRLLGETDRDSLLSLTNVGLALLELKDYERAEANFTRFLELAKTAVGEAHPDYVRTLTNLASVYERSGKLAKSEPVYKRSLELTQAVWGDATPAIALARNNLARVYAKQGDSAKAEPLFRDALEGLKAQGQFAAALVTAKAVFTANVNEKGAGHADALATAHRVGALELMLGTPKAAETTLEEALKVADTNGSEKGELVARIVNDLGVARYQLARYNDAKALFARSLASRTEALGDIHPDTLQSLRNLGWAEDALGNVVESDKLLRLCYNRLENTVQNHDIVRVTGAEATLIEEPTPEYPLIRIVYRYAPVVDPGFVGELPPQPMKDMVALVSALGHVSLLERQLRLPRSDYSDKALYYANTMFDSQDYQMTIVKSLLGLNVDPDKLPPPFGPKHPVTATALAHRAVWNSRRMALPQERERAVADAQTAARIRREVLGENHPLALDADEIVSLVQAETGDWKAVIVATERILAARRTVLGERHPKIATSLGLLGVALYHRGEISRARSVLTEALAIRTDRLTNSHANTFAVSGDLAVVLRQQGDYATARRLLEEAYTGLRRSVGQKDFRTLAAGANLAVVQLEIGDFAGPEAYFRGMMADGYPFDKNDARLNLAALARTRGDLNEARRLYQDAVDMFPDDSQTLNLLGATLRDMGDYSGAEKALVRTLELRRGAGTTDDSPDVAFTLSSIAHLRQAQGDYKDAAKHFTSALNIYRRQTGPTSRDTAKVASKLGLVLMLAGDLPEARKALGEALRAKAAWSREQLPGLAEADAVGFISGLGELDPLLTVLSHLPGAKPEDAYAAVWATKGMSTRALVSRRQAAEDTPAVRDAVAELRLA